MFDDFQKSRQEQENLGPAKFLKMAKEKQELEPTKLVVCVYCHRHAHFEVGPTVTAEFAHKRIGYYFLDAFKRDDDIEHYQYHFLKNELKIAPLPVEHLQVNGALLWAINLWNLRLYKLDREPDLTFHEFRRAHKRSVCPPNFLVDMDLRLEVGVHPENRLAL